MGALSARSRPNEIEIQRTVVDDDEQLFGSVLSDVARTLWPRKTAENIAAAANCSVRAAEFYLAGERDWSGNALAAIVAEILKRHSMRNVKVTAR